MPVKQKQHMMIVHFLRRDQFMGFPESPSSQSMYTVPRAEMDLDWANAIVENCGLDVQFEARDACVHSTAGWEHDGPL